MDVRQSLREKKAAVEDALERVLAGDSRLLEAMRYAVLPGGKRYRPLLLLAAGEAFGGERGALLPYACAIELIHAYSLVHDDLPCMDNDDTRRGKPSCHKAFGEDTALLAGDGLLTLAFEVLAEAPPGAGGGIRKDRAVAAIARAAGARGMLGGQWLDITWPGSGPTEAGLDELMLLKTGALIAVSVGTGALIGGADAAGLLAMDTYGRNVGLAFQLRDDLCDAGRAAEGVEGTRPNAVAVLGADGARARLAGAVERAVAAAGAGPARPDELREMALSLLRVE